MEVALQVMGDGNCRKSSFSLRRQRNRITVDVVEDDAVESAQVS